MPKYQVTFEVYRGEAGVQDFNDIFRATEYYERKEAAVKRFGGRCTLDIIQTSRMAAYVRAMK